MQLEEKEVQISKLMVEQYLREVSPADKEASAQKIKAEVLIDKIRNLYGFEEFFRLGTD